jgi:hypothetical protein
MMYVLEHSKYSEKNGGLTSLSLHDQFESCLVLCPFEGPGHRHILGVSP